MRPGRFAAVAAVLLGVAVAGPAGAADDPEQALAEKFAPVVALVDQDQDCGPGEPYQPTDVDVVLGNPSVALRGPWDDDQHIVAGPTAGDLSAGLYGYYLDYPGNPLEAGCDYEKWMDATGVGTPTAYAHVAAEQGRLALQYWFFYPFNDYTNKHEGDWEFVQLVFDAGDAAEALDRTPVEVGYSQHEGMEVSAWDDPKLQVVDGTHPVVHAAAGSHANYFDDALYLGTSAEQGFGCDDTRGPATDVRPTVAVVPSDPQAAIAAFPWTGFQGRWGQREEAFYNGPTGPNTKTGWTAPVSNMEQKGHAQAYAVPAGGLFGTSATDFFCSTVSGGSEVVRKLADHPARLLVILAVLGLLVAWTVRRTAWSPVVPLRVARRRAAGQLIRAAARMYASHWKLFIGIGFLTVPASIVVVALQALILGGGGEEGGLRALVAALVAFLVIGPCILLVLAATQFALGEIDRDAEVGVRGAYRLALARWRPLLGALLVSAALVAVLTLTVVLSPLALVVIFMAALFAPVIAFEGGTGLGSLRRSATLVRVQRMKTVVLLTSSILLAGVVGPILGTLLILVTGAPFPLANLVSGITYAVLMPYVGLTMAYLYFDARVRSEVERDEAPVLLPAEI